MPSEFKLACVLFDLDGTLIDSAPDIIAALNKALLQHGFMEVLPETIKPFISYGIPAMVKHSIPEVFDPEIIEKLTTDTLTYYADNIATHSVLYPGIAELLSMIENRALKWGVITNKRERFTEPLMAAFKFTDRVACMISGDTTAHGKPHPEPMLRACEIADVPTDQCVYIGDAQHDILAGRTVSMKTLAATYGYLKPNDTPEQWGADALVSSPLQISTWINAVLCH